MSGILQKGARRFTTQIGAAGVPDAVTTTIPLVSVTGLPTDTQIELVIDRTDASGNLTPVKEEVVRGTVSGTNLINCVRGVEGTAQAHSAGATVNSFLTASMWNNIIEYTRDLPTRGLINGLIVPTVAGNNLTVAIKTLQNTDPTSTNPVFVWIGNTLRPITSAKSWTLNAGTNYANAGSAELATREIDYFVYAGWCTISNSVDLLVSRIPYARTYNDFSYTATNEKAVFGYTGGTVTTSDNVVNVGRFAATLSASASFNWSVPTFTNANLIQEPIYETRWLNWLPTYGASGSMTYTSVTTGTAKYKIANNAISFNLLSRGTTGGTASTAITATIPMKYDIGAGSFPNNVIRIGTYVRNSAGTIEVGYATIPSQSNIIDFNLNTSVTFTLGGNTDIGLAITIVLT